MMFVYAFHIIVLLFPKHITPVICIDPKIVTDHTKKWNIQTPISIKCDIRNKGLNNQRLNHEPIDQFFVEYKALFCRVLFYLI